MSYSSLKSGTDIRGFAADGFENEPLFLSDERVEKIALGFVAFLCSKTDKKADELSVCVGHDSRVSAQRIKSALLRAFSSRGVQVYDCSLASTPAMFMAVLDLNCDGSVQITASHHPWERNGLKFFTAEGGLNPSDISDIITYAAEPYEITGNKIFKDVAEHQLDTYKKRIDEKIGMDDHDVGFVFTPSCVAAYKAAGPVELKSSYLRFSTGHSAH